MRAIDGGLSDLRYDARQAGIETSPKEVTIAAWFRSISAVIAKSSGRAIFTLQASSVTALAKPADHPAASSCSE